MLHAKFNDSGRHLSGVNLEPGDGDGKLEATAAGAAGIEVEDASVLLHVGPMRVAADDDLNAAFGRIEAELLEIVQQKDGNAGTLQVARLGKVFRPGSCVYVTTNGGDRGEFAEGSQHGRIADVAGVENAVHAAKRFEGLRPYQAVCVRDDADLHNGVSQA